MVNFTCYLVICLMRRWRLVRENWTWCTRQQRREEQRGTTSLTDDSDLAVHPAVSLSQSTMILDYSSLCQLRSHNLILPEAMDMTQNRSLWRMWSMYGATQSWVACQKRWWQFCVWLGGRVVRTLDLWSIGHMFYYSFLCEHITLVMIITGFIYTIQL